MKLKEIPLDQIDPNPENPRGINIEDEDPKLSRLKDSIQTFGVLVPIVVTERDKRFLLIDGERRYWASRQLQKKRIPAYVVGDDDELSDDEILVRMFQIHHTGEQWGPVQQCRALERTYAGIIRSAAVKKLESDKAKLAAVVEGLVDATGIDERTALNRAYFLRWPNPIKQKLYDSAQEPGYWYICEIEEKIIIPSLANYPEYFERVPVDEVRTSLFNKLDAHSVDKAVEVRKVAPFFRTSFSAAKERNAVKSVLKQLHTDVDMTYGEAQEELAGAFPELLKGPPLSPRKLLTLIESLTEHINAFDIDDMAAATRRAKVDSDDMVDAATSLVESLNELIGNLT